jgi:hypothetical protein
LHVLPEAARDLLYRPGNLHGWGWRIGVAAALALLGTLVLVVANPRRGRWVWSSVGLVIVVLAGMSMGRQSLRASYLREQAGYTLSGAWSGSTHWQWGAIGMFAACLVLAIFLVGVMLWWAWAARPAPDSTDAPGSEQAPTEGDA